MGNGDDFGEAGGGDVLQQKTRSPGGKGTPNNGGVVKRREDNDRQGRPAPSTLRNQVGAIHAGHDRIVPC